MMRRCWGVTFSALSRETVRVYGPHPFDQQTANRLCTDLDSAHTLRMLGIVDGEAGAQIIAYFIVHFGVYESDARRWWAECAVSIRGRSTSTRNSVSKRSGSSSRAKSSAST